MLRTAVLALFRGTRYANDLMPDSVLFQYFRQLAVFVVYSPQIVILVAAALALVLAFPGAVDVIKSPGLDYVWEDLSSSSPPDLVVRQAWLRGPLSDSLQIAWAITSSVSHALDSSSSSSPSTSYSSSILSPTELWPSRDAFLADPFPSSTLSRAPSALVANDSLILSLISTSHSTDALWTSSIKSIDGDNLETRYSAHSTVGILRHIPTFSPLSGLMLAAAYLVALLYLIISLKRMPAMRSKYGLFVAFMVEVALSLAGAATLLHWLDADSARLPISSFPFIFFVLATENMFRLLNALAYARPDQPATVRIGTALGKVGFLSTVTYLSNIGILVLAAILTSPPVRQICIFTVLALIIDYFLHMSYFVAVLSIDVRRLELEDLIQSSLDAPSNDADDSDDDDILALDESVQRSWNPFPKILGYFTRGRVPTTTTAGTAVMGCFLLLIQFHYLGQLIPSSLLTMHWSSLIAGHRSSVWCRIPEFFSCIADDLAALLPPGRSSISVEFYEPDYFTVATNSTQDLFVVDPSLTSSLSSSAILPSSGVFFVTLLILALLTTALVLQHMLRDVRDEAAYDPRFRSSPVFVTKDLSGCHSLDVVRLATSSNGLVASLGLDHKIFIWQVNSSSHKKLKASKVPLPSEPTTWPVSAIALDTDGRFLAICSKSGKVHCWSIATSRFVWTVELAGLENAAPAAILFLTEKVPGMVTRVNLVVVGRNGMLYQIATDSSGVVFEHKITDETLDSAEKLFTPRLPKRIVSATRTGNIVITMLVRTTWISQKLDLRPGMTVILEQQQILNPMNPKPDILTSNAQNKPQNPNEIMSIVPLPQIGMVLRTRGIKLDLIDVQTGTIVKEFQIGQYRRGSLHAFHDHTQHCPFCGCSTIATLCIVYTERESGMMIMHTFVATNRARKNICLRVERDPREKRCIGFEGVLERQHWLADVSGWEVTDINVVMGIRRRTSTLADLAIHSASLTNDGHSSSEGLHHRVANGSGPATGKEVALKKYSSSTNGQVKEECWEGWTMGMDGTVNTYDLRPDNIHRDLQRYPRSRTRQRYSSSSDEEYDADTNGNGEEYPTPGSPARRRKKRHTHHYHVHPNVQDLLVSHIGPVAKLGHRSTVIGFGNTVRVLYFGSEEIISPNDNSVDDDDVGLAYVSRRRRAGRRSDSRGSIGSPATSPMRVASSGHGGGLMSGGLMNGARHAGGGLTRGGLMGGSARRGGLMGGGARF